jgi:hypothetical protein
VVISLNGSGASATGSAGSFGVAVTVGLTGVGSTGTAGTFATAVALVGASAVGYVGGSNTTVNSVSESLTSGLRFSADGTSLFSFAGATLHEYTLFEAGNPLTAVWSGSANIGSVVGASSLKGLEFSPDGTKLIVMANTVAQGGITLTRTSNVVNVAYTAHGLVTGRHTRVFIAGDASYNTASSQITVVDANNFTYASTGSDGSTTGAVDTSGICICTLSPAWDISSATLTTATAMGSRDNLAFSPDGYVLLLVPVAGAAIERFELPAPYDISGVVNGLSYGTPPSKGFFYVSTYVGGDTGIVTALAFTSDLGLILGRSIAANRINLNFNYGYPVDGLSIPATNLVGICQSPKGYIVGVDSSHAFHILGGSGVLGIGGTEVALTGVTSGATAAGVLSPPANVNVTLTGQAATCHAGTLGATRSVALTSAAGTGAAGTLGATRSVALTGVAATGARGSPSVAFSKALTGVAGTGARGNLGIGAALTGVSATGARGNFGTGIGLTGVSATGSVGIAAGGASVGLSGVSATASIGTLAKSFSIATTGVAGTGAAGTLTAGFSKALTGVAGTGAVGTLGFGAALTGATATGAAGTLTPLASGVSVALSGVSATGAAGSAGVSVYITPTGVTTTGAAGSPAKSFTVGLTGVSGAGFAGMEGVALGLIGAASTGSTGSLGVSITTALEGEGSTGTAGSAGTGLQLVGGTASGFAGNVNPAFDLALAGAAATAASGTLTKGVQLQLVGNTATGEEGTQGVVFAVPLGGVSATGQAGLYDTSIVTSVALTGVDAFGPLGSLGVVSAPLLAGVTTGTFISTLGASVVLDFTGAESAGDAGILLPEAAFDVDLTGLSATGEAGSVSAVFIVDLPGAQSDGVSGVLAVPISGASLGVSGVGAIGSLTPVVEFAHEHGALFVLLKDAPVFARVVQAEVTTLKPQSATYVLLRDASVAAFVPQDGVEAFLPSPNIRVAA